MEGNIQIILYACAICSESLLFAPVQNTFPYHGPTVFAAFIAQVCLDGSAGSKTCNRFIPDLPSDEYCYALLDAGVCCPLKKRWKCWLVIITTPLFGFSELWPFRLPLQHYVLTCLCNIYPI